MNFAAGVRLAPTTCQCCEAIEGIYRAISSQASKTASLKPPVRAAPEKASCPGHPLGCMVTRMTTASRVDTIEKWFNRRSDDGDFVCSKKPGIFSIIAPPGEQAPVLFVTKPSTVATAILESGASVGMIGREGLPIGSDAQWIRRAVGKATLLFLGDMDPADLMIFAWLRARMHPKKITHRGINDAFLHDVDVFLPESFIMKCSPSEQKALPILNSVFPDYAAVVGPNCADLLANARKIELEAIISAKGSVEPIVAAAIR